MASGAHVEVSVGAVTDTGPRPVNADRLYTLQSPPPLYSHYSGMDHNRLAHAVASVAGSAVSASTIAGRVLDAARTLGLEDNATVAAAVMSTSSVDLIEN